MWFILYNTFPKIFVIFYLGAKCEAISNVSFNDQIRDYSVDQFNITDVKTLQKQGLGLSRYASFAPVQNVVKLKDVADSVISETSYSRGLVQHDHNGYGFDYEDPHYGYGYEYKPHEPDHHDGHDYHYYDFHDGHHHSPGHHHGYGHYHKHHDHGLAAKTFLWPIAGIALLGAAAALVSNPVLLQLGVVSGKRRRRHAEEIENIARNSINKWNKINNKEENDNPRAIAKNMLRKGDLKVAKRVKQLEKDTNTHFEKVLTYLVPRHTEEDRRFIPIPLKVNKT